MTERARWLRFNMVGVAGFAVQMVTLAVLERWFAAPAAVAVTLAVLAAVSHNFLWHERVTWPGQPNEGRFRRWLSFNVSTGVVAVLTNLIVTTTVTTVTGAPLLVSNVIAVVSASLVNFWVSDRAVFNSNTRARSGARCDVSRSVMEAPDSATRDWCVT
jgi:putative flippase GtrA